MASELNMGRRREGMWWLSGVLDPERGAELNAAINAQARKLAGDQTATANTRAAALHHLAINSGTGPPAKLGIGFIIDPEAFGYPPTGHSRQGHHDGSSNGNSQQSHDRHNGSGTHRHSSHDDQRHHQDNGGPSNGDGSAGVGVAQTWAGDDYDPDAIQRLACDADWYAIVINQLGHPDAVGRTRRAATMEQRLALRALYRGCPLDGTPFDHCDLHHVNMAFENGGSRSLRSLREFGSAKLEAPKGRTITRSMIGAGGSPWVPTGHWISTDRTADSTARFRHRNPSPASGSSPGQGNRV